MHILEISFHTCHFIDISASFTPHSDSEPCFISEPLSFKWGYDNYSDTGGKSAKEASPGCVTIAGQERKIWRDYMIGVIYSLVAGIVIAISKCH